MLQFVSNIIIIILIIINIIIQNVEGYSWQWITEEMVNVLSD